MTYELKVAEGRRIFAIRQRGVDLSAGQDRNTSLRPHDVVFGLVDANRRHYELTAKSLADADQGWLKRLISRRVPLSNWQEALEPRPDDIKVVVDFSL